MDENPSDRVGDDIADKDCDTRVQSSADHEVAPADTARSTGNATSRNSKGTHRCTLDVLNTDVFISFGNQSGCY